MVNLAPPEPSVSKTTEPSVDPPQTPEVTLEEMKPVLATYCYGCHGDKGKVKGEVNLKELTSAEDFLSRIELVGKAAQSITFQEMPPRMPNSQHPKSAASWQPCSTGTLKNT